MSPTGSVPGRAGVRLRRLIGELVKFGAVGGLGVLVNLGVFNLCRAATGLAVVRCSVVATVVAIAFNYVGLRYFTYRDRQRGGRARELTLFAVFSAVGLVIENGVLFAATYGLGWNGPLQSNVIKFLGIGVATLFRFWSYRTLVFRLPEPAPAVSTEPVDSAGPPAARRRDADQPVR
ncbi:GtrA family protein [Streptomyces sp. CT34]|uniref:GtrA family protein n=1 Tax=Streptomyces sp. CT34 TaxID=1553907 RepID=UPI00068CDB1E|nr:GtrA family protein [Streptomyces sp. CT34]